ncbi:MAG: shikimate kinase [Acidobacteria bacterium]|nr:shikimate kinase [Acidobacteriota bacterium]
MPASGESRTRKSIALSGFMGAGKTTVGRALAQQIGWRFVDLDSRIEEHANLNISAIFERLGEPAFRQMESEILTRTLGEAAEREQSLVLALGGGTFVQPQNMAMLRGAGSVVVWLDCPLEQLISRCATMTNRPLFRDETGFRMLFTERLPFYEQSDFRVPSNSEPRQVVEQILALGILERVNA